MTKIILHFDLVQVEKPEINARQVLLKVTAAGVNPLDNMISRGEVKLIVPYKIPLIPGNEVVGIVEAIGEQVSGLKKVNVFMLDCHWIVLGLLLNM